jgi:hypothetical protein
MTRFSIALKDRLLQLKIAEDVKRIEKNNAKQEAELSLRTPESIASAKAKLVPFIPKTPDRLVLVSRTETCSECSYNSRNVCLLTGTWVDIFTNIAEASCPKKEWT